MDAASDAHVDAASDALADAASSPDCHALLDQLGVIYAVGPAAPGVSDPVTVNLPLNGVDYVAKDALVPDSSLFMNCSLAVALHQFGEIVGGYGVVTAEYVDVYKYACIGGANPDSGTCTLSQHAFGNAIDVHELRTSSAVYNVETDWNIDATTEATCTAATSSAADAILHEIACALHDQGVFSIVLTPNYSPSQRSFIHADLSAGANFID